jgi:hypothetical protein
VGIVGIGLAAGAAEGAAKVGAEGDVPILAAVKVLVAGIRGIRGIEAGVDSAGSVVALGSIGENGAAWDGRAGADARVGEGEEESGEESGGAGGGGVLESLLRRLISASISIFSALPRLFEIRNTRPIIKIGLIRTANAIKPVTHFVLSPLDALLASFSRLNSSILA